MIVDDLLHYLRRMVMFSDQASVVWKYNIISFSGDISPCAISLIAWRPSAVFSGRCVACCSAFRIYLRLFYILVYVRVFVG